MQLRPGYLPPDHHYLNVKELGNDNTLGLGLGSDAVSIRRRVSKLFILTSGRENV